MREDQEFTIPHGWLLEPLFDEPSLETRPMFGCWAVYLHGRMVLVLAEREPPWSGLLVPTERAHHPSLMDELPALDMHPVLGKWLYISDSSPDFARTAHALVKGISEGDERIGIVPKRKKRRRKSVARRKR